MGLEGTGETCKIGLTVVLLGLLGAEERGVGGEEEDGGIEIVRGDTDIGCSVGVERFFFLEDSNTRPPLLLFFPRIELCFSFVGSCTSSMGARGDEGEGGKRAGGGGILPLGVVGLLRVRVPM